MVKIVIYGLVVGILLVAGCGQQIHPDVLEATAEKPARDAYATQQAEDFAVEATLWAIEATEAVVDEALDSYYATQDAQLEEITYYVSVPVANVRTCPDLSCPVALKLTMNTRLFDPFPADSAPGWFEVEIDGKWYYMHESVISKHPVSTPMSTRVPSIETGCPNGCINPPTGCNVKGNISFDTGEKIYHLPGDEFYTQTVINTDYGERWFCTPEEAEANGWRRAYK
jgi:hypothetical protein